jgi:adenylate cyclase
MRFGQERHLKGLTGRAYHRLRLGSGLVLFAYVLTHNLNHALGLVSLDAIEAGRLAFLAFWRWPPAELALALALIAHFTFGLRSLYQRQSLRMPAMEWSQLALGLGTPPLLALHVLGTRAAVGAFATDDTYVYVIWATWVVSPWLGWMQALALVTAWVHGCIGLHYWLRVKSWFPQWSPALSGAALLLPVAALAGFVVGGKEVAHLAADPNWLPTWAQSVRLPGEAQVAQIYEWLRWFLGAYALTIGAVFLARALRHVVSMRRAIAVSYLDGARVVIQPGTSLLEASRIGNIPHASICGGHSRCSTCRVKIISGREHLAQPSAEEARVLARVKAAPDVRLACQTRPTGPVTIQPLLPPTVTARTALSGADLAQGREMEVAILFADLRGFTSLSEKRLPYDVVFLLNQYFRLMGVAVREAGGHLDKFIGDGVMAIFGLDGRADLACGRAFDAARRMAEGIDAFNRQHQGELTRPLVIGIGIHFGPAIVGEMGFGKAIALTAIGDTVNTASRLEGATKDMGCQVLISKAAAVAGALAQGIGRGCEVALRGRDQTLEAVAVASANELGER